MNTPHRKGCTALMLGLLHNRSIMHSFRSLTLLLTPHLFPLVLNHPPSLPHPTVSLHLSHPNNQPLTLPPPGSTSQAGTSLAPPVPTGMECPRDRRLPCWMTVVWLTSSPRSVTHKHTFCFYTTVCCTASTFLGGGDLCVHSLN